MIRLTALALSASLAALAPACGGDDDDTPPTPDADPNAPDADPGAPDADPGAPDAAAPDAAAPNCGTEELPVGMITDTEGIAIAPDGTVYYSQFRAVGRRVPGGPVENDWVGLPASASVVYGLALGPDGTLYVASNSGDTIYRIDTASATPMAEVLTSNANNPNGLVVGPDGAVYYGDFQNDRVFRVDASGGISEVTTSDIPAPNGLLFEEDGTLLVLAYVDGDIIRLTLDAQMRETSRQTVGSVAGAFLDGIARDELGRYYVTANNDDQLIRLDSSFGNPEVLLTNIGAAANIAFGKGALNCNDVYVASSGALGLYHGDATGIP